MKMFILILTIVFLTPVAVYALSDVGFFIIDPSRITTEIMRRIAADIGTGGFAIALISGTTFSVAIFVEQLHAIETGQSPDLAGVLGRALTCLIFILAFDRLFGAIHNIVYSLSLRVDAGGDSVWDSLASFNEQFTKNLGALDNEKSPPVWKLSEWFMAKTGIHILGGVFLVISIILKASILFIKASQGIILTLLYISGPLAAAVSVIRGINLLPAFILTLFSVNSWGFFSALIARCAREIVQLSGNVNFGVGDVVTALALNFMLVLAILSVPAIAALVFRSGGSVASLVTIPMVLAMNSAIKGVRNIASVMPGGGNSSHKNPADYMDSATAASSMRPVGQRVHEPPSNDSSETYQRYQPKVPPDPHKE